MKLYRLNRRSKGEVGVSKGHGCFSREMGVRLEDSFCRNKKREDYSFPTKSTARIVLSVSRTYISS